MIANTSNDLSKDNVGRLSLEVRSILCAKFNTYPHKVSIGLGSACVSGSIQEVVMRPEEASQ